MWLSMKDKLFLASVFALSTVSLSAVSAWYAYSKGKQSGTALVQQKWDSEKLIVAQNHALQVQALNTQLQKAQNEFKQREIRLRRDAAASRSAADGLRQQLTETNARIATASAEAVAEYARTVSLVFEDCTRTYRDVAEKADGHANDALMLQQAWPERNNDVKDSNH